MNSRCLQIEEVIEKHIAPFKNRRNKMNNVGPFRRHPLTKELWEESFDAEGCLTNADEVIHRIRLGGIEPDIRAEVWPFILGLYEIDSTAAQRKAQDEERRQSYENRRKQCKMIRKSLAGGAAASNADENNEEVSFTEEQVAEFVKTGGSKSRSTIFWKNQSKACKELITWQRIIRLDAVRINPDWVEHSPSQANVTLDETSDLVGAVDLSGDEHLETCQRYHAARLVAILEAYALYDPETGYCQGMCDLLSPFVALMDEDYKAFYAFASFMRTTRHNFRSDEVGIQRQLKMVSDIIRASDPKLYEHLVKIKSEDCTFVYRIVVVLFRRELSLEQTISLWEVMWSDWTANRTKKVDLLLFTIVAAIYRKRRFIMEKCTGMDEVLRVCNSMAGKHDIWELLGLARKLANHLA